MSEAVKEGYKETKIGVIPEDWMVRKLGNIGSFSKGRNISKAALKETGLPCVIYGDLYTKHHDYIKNITHFIDQQQAELSYEIEYGDILFATSGETSEEIGKCAVYLGNQPAFAGGDIVVFKSSQNDPKYLGYLLNYYSINKQKYRLAQGYSVVHIYASHLKNIYIPIPPLSEQKKIAEILSTWDRALETLEQLIAEKEKLKRGLMQQLLSGKTRFPGFEGEWEERRIGELFKFLRSIAASRSELVVQNDEDEVLNLHYGDLHVKYNSQTILDVSSDSTIPALTSGFKLSAQIDEAKDGDVVFVDASEDYEGVGECIELVNIEDKIITAGLHTFLLRDHKDSMVDGFRSLIFDQPAVKKQLKRIVTGSNVYGLSKTNLAKVEVRLPSQKEQLKIATVLQNAEKDVSDLQRIEDTLKTQKKGLMQQLLTGKTRVKVS